MKAFLVFCVVAGSCAWCQDAPGDRVSVPFSDPSRPKTLRASLLNGSITVRGYDGKEAIVEAQGPDRGARRAPDRPDGLHRLELPGAGLEVDEANNVVQVRIGARSINSKIHLTIQVPFDTSLNLKAVNGGNIEVDHVNGDVEVNNTNGNVTVSHISGSAVVHALNGKIVASLDKVAADKPMSFSSLNGDIDVTLPADVRARVKLKSDNGDVYTDFDLKVDTATPQPQLQPNSSGRGRYRVRFDRATYGSINGGGPEVQLTTFNGSIYLRKAK